MNEAQHNLPIGNTGSIPTDAHLAMHALFTQVALTAARRRQEVLPGLTESLQDEVLLTVGGTSRPVHGWFAEGTWRLGDRPVHELFLNGDRRSEYRVPIRQEEEVLVTLLHECCHAYAQANSIKETSRDGRYHNRRFAEIALAIGLDVTKDKHIGHRTPQLSIWARDDYADLLSALKDGLVLERVPQLMTSNPGSIEANTSTPTATAKRTLTSKPKYVFAACRCRTARGVVTLRVAAGSWRPGVIQCRQCDTTFEEFLPS